MGKGFARLMEASIHLSTEDLAIADTDGPVALAGVMGGEESGVTDATTDVLLESALFEPVFRAAVGSPSQSAQRIELSL